MSKAGKTHKAASGTEKGTGRQGHSQNWEFEMHLWVHWLLNYEIKTLLRIFTKHHMHAFVFMLGISRTFAQPHGSIVTPIINTEVTTEDSSGFNAVCFFTKYKS